MKRILLFLLLLSSVLWAKMSIVTLDGTVDNGMACLLNRSLENRTVDDTIVFRINTYGGLLFSAFDMADSIFKSDAYTIAFVEQKAISAGAMLSIASNEIVMSEGSTIGDCAPVVQGEYGPEIMNEKIQSPLRAKFRLWAEANGYPIYLAAAMVSPDLLVYEIITEDTTYYSDLVHDAPKIDGDADTVTMVDYSELLTLTATEAVQTGFSTGIVDDFESFSDSLGVTDEAEIFERTWSEDLVAMLGTIAPFLIMLGMAGLYIESRTPGIGYPGIIGAIALLFAYAGHHVAGLAGFEEYLLLGIGLILLAAEVFVIPGFGVAGIAGIGCIALSGILLMQNFTIPSPEIPFQELILMSNVKDMAFSLIGSVGIVVLFFWLVFPRMKNFKNGPILSETIHSTVEVLQLVGLEGVAIKDLRPAGTIEIDGEAYDATSNGFLIEKGESVVVSEQQGHRLIVRKRDV